MLVIALDTSTPAVTAGLVSTDGGRARVLAERVTINPRAHGELLMPQVLDLLTETGHGFGDVDAIVAGIGPGPFTGLRVGLVTATALGQARGIPVHPVVSTDAIAAAADTDGPLLVATDARRKETFWAAYDGGSRVDGPHVAKPAEVPTDGYQLAAGELAEAIGLRAIEPTYPTALGLVTAADLDAEPKPLVPLYLRRPDATEPGARKSVLTGGSR